MTCMIRSLQCFHYTKSQFDVRMLTTLGLESPIHVLRREWQVGARRGLVPQLQSCALSSPSLVPAVSLVGLRTAPGEKHESEQAAGVRGPGLHHGLSAPGTSH